MYSGQGIGGSRKGENVRDGLYVDVSLKRRGNVGEHAKALREPLFSGAGGMLVFRKTMAGGTGCLSCFFG